MSRFDADFAEVGEPIVELRLPRSAASDLSHALSDLLCWSRGFMAGQPDDTSSHPMGVNEASEFNLALKGAIARAERAAGDGGR